MKQEGAHLNVVSSIWLHVCAGIDVVQFTIIACVVENRTREIEMKFIL